jgi:hypothetical protein
VHLLVIDRKDPQFTRHTERDQVLRPSGRLPHCINTRSRVLETTVAPDDYEQTSGVKTWQTCMLHLLYM